MDKTLTIKWYDSVKGFGFAAPEDGTSDAFLHVSALQRLGLKGLNPGDRIRAEVGESQKGRTVVAVYEVLQAPPGREVKVQVKWYKPEKGYGFLSPCDGGKDIFVHKSVLEAAGLSDGDVRPGLALLVEVKTATKGDEAVKARRDG
jgi:CspA family cold shock protein